MYKITCYILVLLTTACNNLEKIIDVALPAYDKKLVVECYIIPNKPYKLLLTQSVSYFDDASLPFVNFAKVYITHAGITDTLTFNMVIDTISQKIYNYTSKNIAKVDAKQPFALFVEDNEGKTVTATTTLPPPLIVDSVNYIFKNNDTTNEALIKAFISTKVGEENIFRFFLNIKDSMGGNSSNRIFNNRFAQNQQIATFTTYRFKTNDSIWVNIQRINLEYSEYYNSTRGAFNANVSPFSQSVRLKSNINGGIGIFTALRSYRKLLIIGK